MTQHTHPDRVTLRPGKDKAVKQHHPWIFSGAIANGGKNRAGDILPVYNDKGEKLGSGYFNSKSSIIGRMLCFDDRDPMKAIAQHLEAAVRLRAQLFPSLAQTNAYRLVNGEGDGLPGLVVDRYHDVLVIQISTLGMDRLRDVIIKLLVTLLQPQAIYEKSIQPVRAEEGLAETEQWLLGTARDEVEILENGLKILVSPTQGQKTGFFLDQREMRSLVRRYAIGRRVLNFFSYTGAFSVAALAGGATHATSVDASGPALALADRNVALNGFSTSQHEIREADVFRYLREEKLGANFIILDPPAFAKRRTDVIKGCRGYKDINRLAIQGAPPGSFLVTCSCSHFVEDSLFQKVVFQASVEAKRNVRILAQHHAAMDHPVDICHPEAHYLKSLFLYIE